MHPLIHLTIPHPKWTIFKCKMLTYLSTNIPNTHIIILTTRNIVYWINARTLSFKIEGNNPSETYSHPPHSQTKLSSSQENSLFTWSLLLYRCGEMGEKKVSVLPHHLSFKDCCVYFFNVYRFINCLSMLCLF